VVMVIASGRVVHARVALGGVGTKPWRSLEAEQALEGKFVQAETFAAAARDALKPARAQSENGFKIELATRCLTHALNTVANA